MTIMCIEAANYLVDLTNRYNGGKEYGQRIIMSCKRLQKLLYFSDVSYMLTHDGESMFTDEFYAWPSGPVIPSVYNKFVQFQTGDMIKVEGSHTPLTDEMKDALEKVFKATLNMSTSELVDESHREEGPWSTVYNSSDPDHKQIIDKTAIYQFYLKNTVFANCNSKLQ